MKKSDSKRSLETPEEELKRLRKENSKLKAKLQRKSEADKSKINRMLQGAQKKEEHEASV